MDDILFMKVYKRQKHSECEGANIYDVGAQILSHAH